MDIVCTRCGEPWDTVCLVEDKQLPEEEREFVLDGSAILRCPSCDHLPESDSRIQHASQSPELAGLAEVGYLLGDDIDGMASFIDDMGLA